MKRSTSLGKGPQGPFFGGTGPLPGACTATSAQTGQDILAGARHPHAELGRDDIERFAWRARTAGAVRLRWR
jgi:hypothetical protein